LIEPTSNYIILKYQKSVIASAGGGAINCEIDSQPLVIDKQLLDHINSRYKYTEILQVFGESMEPDIKEGSLVFVDKQDKELKSTGVYLIRTNEAIYLKHVNMIDNTYYMISTNKQYKDIRLDQFEILGRLKRVFTKF